MSLNEDYKIRAGWNRYNLGDEGVNVFMIGITFNPF